MSSRALTGGAPTIAGVGGDRQRASTAPLVPPAAVRASTETAPSRAPRRDPLSSMRYPLGAYLLSRAIVLCAAAAAVVTKHGADLTRGPWPRVRPVPAIVQPFVRWDAAWYIDLARRGYLDLNRWHHLRRAAFFPLFPTLTAGVARATGLSAETSAMVVGTAAGLLATWGVWELMRQLCDEPTANRAVVLFCLFPGAFVLSMPYAETVMVAAVAFSLLALHQRRWLTAGLLAALATASRPNAAPIIIACGLAASTAIWRRRDWPALSAPLLAPCGVLAFFLYLRSRTGQLFLWLRSEHLIWRDRMDFGASTATRAIHALVHPHLTIQRSGLEGLVALLGLSAIVVGVNAMRRWRPPAPVAAYALTSVFMAVSSHNIGPRPRMLLAAFPLVVAPAVELNRRSLLVVAVLFGGALAIVSFLIFTTGAMIP